MLDDAFFDRDARQLAQALLGKVLRHRVDDKWLAAMIIETEAYYLEEKGSHSSQGRTPSREPMFMPPGTIYMYYARGGDSMNISAQGAGNAVLLKSGRPLVDAQSPRGAAEEMMARNPKPNGKLRPLEKLCSGQTLLCRALGLRVPDWTGKRFCRDRLFIDDIGYAPGKIVQTRRLGIPPNRDEHLPYRFLDAAHASSCTSNPLTRRSFVEGVDYWVISGVPGHDCSPGNGRSGPVVEDGQSGCPS